ncbi:hypothetical protein V6N13_049838 [Hibiscus sabdariffa]
MATTSSKSLFRWVQGQQGRNPVHLFSLGTDGNLVLIDADGRIAWQSNTANKGVVAGRLVNRASAKNNIDGAYSSVMEPRELVLQYKGLNTPKPLVYFRSSVWPSTQDHTLQTVILDVEETNDGFAYEACCRFSSSDRWEPESFVRTRCLPITERLLSLGRNCQPQKVTCLSNDFSYCKLEEVCTLY